MGHHCCSKQKVKRGLWSPEEDEKLMNYITNHGHGCWSSVPKLAGLQRCGKSCRLRWINYLRPDLKRGTFSAHEERIIIDVHRILGNRWAQIAKHLPGRTDNEVKNFWNSYIKKKLIAQGLDPKTHNLMPAASRANNNANNYYISNVTNLSQFQNPTTTIPFTISTSSNVKTNSNYLDHTSNNNLVTLPTSSNFPMHEYQDPNLLMSFDDQDSLSLIDYANCTNESMYDACTWVNGGGNNVANVETLEGPLKKNIGIAEEQAQAQAHEMINIEYNASAFDLDLMDTELMPCGIFGGSSPMEQLQWDC